MAARLIAYVGTLALLAIVALHQWNELRIDAAATPAAPAGWSAATRSYPAFAISQSDFIGKTETYEILRHPEGGRKDVMRWVAAGENPVAELEIYRRGGESNPPQPPLAELANRVDPGGGRELEAAGVIDSKFGPVSLLRPTGQTDRRPPCLAFLKQIDDPDFRLAALRLGLPGRHLAGRARQDRLPLEPADSALRRKRAETGGIIRPRRAPARRLRRRGRLSTFGGLGDQCRKPEAARRAVIGRTRQI